MKWILLERIDQLQEIKKAAGYSILFKHSTRCAISMMAKKKFESEWKSLPSETPVFFLDLLNHRDISAAVVQLFEVHHESPQLLLIRDGECIYHTSHGEVSADEAAAQMKF